MELFQQLSGGEKWISGQKVVYIIQAEIPIFEVKSDYKMNDLDKAIAFVKRLPTVSSSGPLVSTTMNLKNRRN